MTIHKMAGTSAGFKATLPVGSVKCQHQTGVDAMWNAALLQPIVIIIVVFVVVVVVVVVVVL